MVGDQGGPEIRGEVIMVGIVEAPADAYEVIFLFKAVHQAPDSPVGLSEPAYEPRHLWIAVQGVDMPVCFKEEKKEPLFAG